jgi:hypothetical protein
MSATLTGEGFAPLPEQSHFSMGLVTNHRFKTSDAFRTLVEIGPDALPFLLEGLVDKTPTKLKVGTALALDGGLMWLSTELGYNTLNPMERQVFSEETETKEDEEESTLRRLYTLKVGDICLVAIGQIVGRSYNAVRYQPTFIIIINSPLEKKEIRERVWRLWGSNNPSQKLLDSLLIDYATEGIFNGESLDGWDEGSDYQTQAAMRLLYYFPKETAPLIATRLRSSDVVQKVGFSECIKREVKNGVRTDKFIRAVSWCSAPPIKEALADIAKHTNDPDIKAAVEGKRGPRGPRR